MNAPGRGIAIGRNAKVLRLSPVPWQDALVSGQTEATAALVCARTGSIDRIMVGAVLCGLAPRYGPLRYATVPARRAAEGYVT